MFIKKFDMLSPPITLFYKGENNHSSILSAILTIIAYAIIIAAGFYYALIFINRESPTAYFFNRYVEDAGTFPINSTSMFNFVQIYSTTTSSPIPTDFNKLEIVGIDVTIDNYESDPDLSKFNHWVYGNCNNDTDTEGIKYLINQDLFTECACIKKYYNKETKKYYDLKDKNFIWPYIIHGASHPDVNYYGVLIRKCANTELRINNFEQCSSDEDIDKYIEHIYVNFRIIDHYADVLNYQKPFTKYLYSITSGIFNGTYTINHLNFNPALMQTHNGIFFDNIVEEPAYFFTLNEKITSEVGNTRLISGFYFWMQNVQQYYEREYKRLQDILSDIGGIGSIILIIAQAINFLISNFIILLDTEELISSFDQQNFKKGEKKPTLYRTKNEIMIPPKRHRVNNDMLNNSQQSSNYEENFKEGINIVKKNNISDDGNINNNIMKKNDSLNHYLKKKFKLKKDNTLNVNDNINIYNQKNEEQIPESYKIPTQNNKDYRGIIKLSHNNDENLKEELYKERKQYNYKKFNNDKNNRINSEIKIFNSERANLPEEVIEKINRNKNYKINNDENYYYNNEYNEKSNVSESNNESKNSDLDKDKDIEVDTDKYKSKNRSKNKSYNKYKNKYKNKNKNIKSKKKQNFNWFEYILYLICCGKNNPKIQYYEDFRAQIISEENIIQNHLDVYKLLKACQIETSHNLVKNFKDE